MLLPTGQLVTKDLEYRGILEGHVVELSHHGIHLGPIALMFLFVIGVVLLKVIVIEAKLVVVLWICSV